MREGWGLLFLFLFFLKRNMSLLEVNQWESNMKELSYFRSLPFLQLKTKH